MRVHLLNDSSQKIGGGWTFIENFKEAAIYMDDLEIVDIWFDADIILIPSSSMVDKKTVREIEAAKKPYVLRVDNVPRNSRNRNTGTPRLLSYAQGAKAVVYQSNWAKGYLFPFLQKSGRVIYNGIDLGIFNTIAPPKREFPGSPVYLYSRFNRDETKSWERAQYRFQMIHRDYKEAFLVIVGQFSQELIDANFDFFMGERFEYLGVVDTSLNMAVILRSCNVLLAPYFNDAYSNTIQEAIACNLEIEFDMSGGTPELIENGPRDRTEMVAEYFEVFKGVLEGGEAW